MSASVLELVNATIKPIEVMGKFGGFPLLLEGISTHWKRLPTSREEPGKDCWFSEAGWLARRWLLLESHGISIQSLMSLEATLNNLVLLNSSLRMAGHPSSPRERCPWSRGDPWMRPQ